MEEGASSKRIEAKRGQYQHAQHASQGKQGACPEAAASDEQRRKTESSNDDRFKDLFSDPDFQIDEASEEFKLSNPSGITSKEIELRKQHGLIPSSDRNPFIDINDSSSGDDDVDNNDEDVFSDKRYVNRRKRERGDESGEEAKMGVLPAGDASKEEQYMKNKPKKKLRAVPIHERVELIPGQSVKQKMIKEKRRKAQKSTLLDRVKAEDEMVERANELRKAAASDANEEGVYSITYKPDEERRRQQKR